MYGRLQTARAKGVTIAQIAKASGGKLTDNQVMDILNAGFRPIEDYHALDAALDECEKDNTSSVTAEP